jgi:DNA mismatch repair ATPase MutS
MSPLTGEFAVLKDGLAIMASHRFRSEKLSALVESIGPDVVLHMSVLQRLVGACEQRRKNVLYQFSFFLCLGTQLALAIERWRRQFGGDLLRWLNAWAEFEAMNAIACYAFEHPDHVFPEIVEGSAPFLDVRNLGHPLLQASLCVTNDLYLDSESTFCLISGSNMAGKSTWLRAVGLAVVLAAAGAPIRATSARMSLFTVCASISIVDSLASGKSKFLAEVERLRITIRAAQHQPPVLFLIDEILSGTNSVDRRQVAESVLNVLVSAGAVGLLSTHDSALVPIAELPRLRGRNVHMSSENPDDPLHFDYRVKPGPVRQTNALAIARMVGIPAMFHSSQRY